MKLLRFVLPIAVLGLSIAVTVGLVRTKPVAPGNNDRILMRRIDPHPHRDVLQAVARDVLEPGFVAALKSLN